MLGASRQSSPTPYALRLAQSDRVTWRFAFTGRPHGATETTTPPPTGCQPTGVEPNDNPGQATSLGSTPDTGNICVNDQDWYRITVPTGGARVRLTFSHAAGDLDLYVYNSSLAQVGESVSETDTETVEIATPGTYYAQVVAYPNGTGSNEAGYQIELLLGTS
jgi:hypothetical protein